MPTIHREAGFRFFFFPNDHPPPHVHVEHGDGAARFELRPIRCTLGDRMKPRDLARAESMIEARAEEFERIWHGYFGTRAGPQSGQR